MQGFAKKFGQYNAQKDLWALPAYLSSVMTSTPFIGKAIVRIKFGLRSKNVYTKRLTNRGLLLQLKSQKDMVGKLLFSSWLFCH